jgi:phospholipid/cholesterol/gamma-HCH transport system substrate-binding protein
MDEYRKQLSWAKLRVGIVVTAALLVLFLTVLFAGNIERLFSRKAVVFAVFDDVKGLRTGAPVWFSGVQIGSVQSLKLEEGEKITVGLSIDQSSLAYLKTDSLANILTLGLLGDKYVELSPGTKEAAMLKEGDTITGSPRPDIKEEVSRIVDRIESRKGSLGRLLEEDTLYRDLAASVRDIKVFAAALKDSKGTLDKLVRDPSLYDRFEKASQSIDAFAQRLAASKGTMNRLIEDESLYRNVDEAAAKLNALLDKINRGEGTVGSLVNDREASDELKKTLKELNALVKDMRENPKKYFQFSIF